MIVDDDSALLRLAETALRRDGFTTATARTGQEALRWLSRKSAELVLLDLGLPDMHGKAFIERLKDRGRSCPFLVMTARGDERQAVALIKQGALDYLVKVAPMISWGSYPQSRQHLIDVNKINPAILPEASYFEEEAAKSGTDPETFFEGWKQKSLSTASERLERLKAEVKPEKVAKKVARTLYGPGGKTKEVWIEEGQDFELLGPGDHLGLPLANHLVDKPAKEGEKPRSLPREKFYVPGSVIRARVDNSHPLAWGLGQQVDFMFQGSPVFRLKNVEGQSVNSDAALLQKVAWFDEKRPLRSGWALGQEYLQNGLAVIETPVGEGQLDLFGPEIAFSAQPHGTFKFLFNGILNASLAR